MKKFLTLICMITCVFGLTACGSEEVLSEYEAVKVEGAKKKAVNVVMPVMETFLDDTNAEYIEQFTIEELEYKVINELGVDTEGYAFKNAVASFHSAKDSMGFIVGYDDNPTAEISGKQIIVHVDVQGEKKSAQAEIIFSNDMFLTLESASLNPTSTMSELMAKAALNTLIGMGTVFSVLILISAIISLLRFIPKIQESFSKKKEAKKATGVDNAVAQITVQENSSDEADNLELVAVIAAAVAASEGAASTDGFVVRSIRRRF